MQKKILTGILSSIWIVACILIGYCISEVRIYQMSAEVTQHIEKLITDIIYYILVYNFLLSCVVVFIIKRAFTQMQTIITKLSSEAESVQLGGDSHVIRHYSLPEFERLIAAFDRMKEHYHRTTRTLQYQKSKAESMVNNLQQGIIIIDENGYIEEQNSYALKYFEELEDLSTNVSINYIFRQVPFVQMLENAYKHQKYGSCEIMKNDKILHIRIHPITRRQRCYGYMLSIIDITRTRQLEEIRYQFVTNVTHELKTPLTSIQGFVETLKEGAIDQPQVARRFLDIIDVEAKRLYRLIQDVLMLSEIENMKNLETQDIKMERLATEVEFLLREQAQQKGINFDVDIEEEIVIKANQDHIKQILVNFVSNAIRYTDRGKVHLNICQVGEEVCIEVSDTGIGIPKENLERVFERFYTVDKSRSRKNGGTGLGLSIVKHIVQLYEGRIEVESKVGEGTRFRAYFK